MTTLSTGSPTVRRRMLGLRLKNFREAIPLVMELVAEQLSVAPRTVQRWENGQGRIPPASLRELCRLYGVNPEEASELEALAKEAHQRSWWTPYTSSVRPTFATFLGLETDAASFMEYSTMVVPGLLQTERYMRAIMRAARPQLDDATIDKRVEIRLQRQRDMRQARAYPRHFVIDQSCLHRRIGGPEVMEEQLRHLIDSAQSRSITVQILPFEVGVHADLLWPFSVLTFDDMPTVACIETLNGDLYAHAQDSERYAGHFDALRERALPETLALGLVETIRREHEACSMPRGASRHDPVRAEIVSRFDATANGSKSAIPKTAVPVQRSLSPLTSGEPLTEGWSMANSPSTDEGSERF